jgi:hypothetical protein
MHPMTVAEDSCGRDRMSKLSFKVDVELPSPITPSATPRKADLDCTVD